jgi:hypothetical protein
MSRRHLSKVTGDDNADDNADGNAHGNAHGNLLAPP